MPQAIANSDDLRRFAGELRQFNSDLHNLMSTLQGRFKRLSESWRDQQQSRFAREFEQTMRALARFSKATEEYIPHLHKKAREIDAYLH